MIFFLTLLFAAGSPPESNANRNDWVVDGSYRAVADGWRRTNRGWEHTASWNLLVMGSNLGAIAVGPEVSFAALAVDRLSRLHPLVVAGVQFAGAIMLLRPETPPPETAD